MKTASSKDSDELDGIIVRVRQDLVKRMEGVDTRLTALEGAIATLAKAIKAGS